MYCCGNAADVLVQALQADGACRQLCLPWRPRKGRARACCAGDQLHILDIQQPTHNLRLQGRELQEAKECQVTGLLSAHHLLEDSTMCVITAMPIEGAQDSKAYRSVVVICIEVVCCLGVPELQQHHARSSAPLTPDDPQLPYLCKEGTHKGAEVCKPNPGRKAQHTQLGAGNPLHLSSDYSKGIRREAMRTWAEASAWESSQRMRVFSRLMRPDLKA